MIRVLAFTIAATLVIMAMSMHRRAVHSAPLPMASAAALNPWSKDAPPPSRYQIVDAATAAQAQSDGHSAGASGYGPTVIDRDATGHFRVTGQVNGQDSEFLIDTGADLVALTRDDAQRLGIFVSPGDFRKILRTASGATDAAPVMIERLTVGGTELHDVPAVVVDGLGTNLLGQSALRQLGKLEQDGDRMVLNPS